MNNIANCWLLNVSLAIIASSADSHVYAPFYKDKIHISYFVEGRPGNIHAKFG